MRIWLRELRQDKGLTQVALAQRLGTQKCSVGSWELGNKDPSRDMVFLLADELGPQVLEHFANEARQRAGKVA